MNTLMHNFHLNIFIHVVIFKHKMLSFTVTGFVFCNMHCNILQCCSPLNFISIQGFCYICSITTVQRAFETMFTRRSYRQMLHMIPEPTKRISSNSARSSDIKMLSLPVMWFPNLVFAALNGRKHSKIQ